MIDLKSLAKVLNVEDPYIVSSCELVEDKNKNQVFNVNVTFNPEVDIIFKDQFNNIEKVVPIYDFDVLKLINPDFLGIKSYMYSSIPRILLKNNSLESIPHQWQCTNTRYFDDFIYEQGVLKAVKVVVRFKSLY